MSKFLNLYLMIRRLIDAIVIKMTDPHFKPSKMRDGLFWESERCLRWSLLMCLDAWNKKDHRAVLLRMNWHNGFQKSEMQVQPNDKRVRKFDANQVILLLKSCMYLCHYVCSMRAGCAFVGRCSEVLTISPKMPKLGTWHPAVWLMSKKQGGNGVISKHL